MSESKDMKKLIIDFYENTRHYYRKYHDHKEISAWSGLVAHIFFCTFIVLANPTVQSIQIKFLMTMVFSISVVIESLLMLRYIKNQLDLKDIAGSYVLGSLKILNELISNNLSEEKLKKFLTLPKDSKNPRFQAPHVLPKKLQKESKKYITKGTGAQDLTRKMNTNILIILSVSVIFYRWVIIL
ncbi:MAG: hypothetical protein ACW964_15230 [Candidatus Hodarchaeales archaeon]|jgi:hypothetical protein